MSDDITRILEDWEYDAEANVRKIVGDDGLQKIQVRVDQGAFQGLLQLNLDGRPDGKRPHDSDFALDHYRSALHGHREEHGTDKGFEVSRPACQELFDESSRVYGRYVFLLQIKEYDRVVRDTERNMDLFRFVHRYASHEDDRQNLQKWWPYILRIHATARAMLAFDSDDHDAVEKILAEALGAIAALPEVDAEEFFVERERSREAVEELLADLTEKRPLTRRQELETELAAAIESEEFERAAELRDQLRELGEE